MRIGPHHVHINELYFDDKYLNSLRFIRWSLAFLDIGSSASGRLIETANPLLHHWTEKSLAAKLDPGRHRVRRAR